MNMIRSLILLVLSALSAVSFSVSAAGPGSWRTYAVFSAPPQKVIDTGSKVYYISGGSLFSYDKKADESYSYTTDNKLNGVDISDIRYNAAKKYLMIVYPTGNIDLLYDDGRVVNLSDIMDSTLEPPVSVNDICFTDGGFIAATQFGLVEFDDSRHEVVQSGIFKKPVTAVTVMGDYIIISVDSEIKAIKNGSRLNTLGNFNTLGRHEALKSMMPAGGGRIIGQNKGLELIDIDLEGLRITGSQRIYSTDKDFSLTVMADGSVCFPADNRLFMVDAARGTVTQAIEFPEEFSSPVIGTSAGLSELWSLNRDGIACHSFEGGSTTVLTQRFRPEEFSVKRVCYFYPTADGRLYVTNNGNSGYRFGITGRESWDIPLNAAVIDLSDGSSTDVTPFGFDANRYEARRRQDMYGKYMIGPTAVTPDPDDKDTYFASSVLDGVYKIKNGELLGIFHENNSPFHVVDERNIGYFTGIDKGGNLWCATNGRTSESDPPLFILPAAKRRLNPDELTREDWVYPNMEGIDVGVSHDSKILFSNNSRYIFFYCRSGGEYLLAYDTRGTYDNFNDDRAKAWTEYIDQDGKVFSPNFTTAMAEDRNGALWMGGYEGGVFVITNPAAAFTDNMTVRRVKVPKNDGTNTADYLLSTDRIYDIAVDAANRKWIATEGSGLFLVSADGSKILENFTPDNSPLPSKDIFSVYADPYSSDIYVGTAYGLYVYTSDATPVMDDFESITVYPNPVSPDYFGPVYIKGLMENSLVKIADASGSVVFQGRSEGGLFSWDCCNSAGRPVPTGVYYVFVSQGSDSSSSGATAKFMIVR